jgi:hypothetical protein
VEAASIEFLELAKLALVMGGKAEYSEIRLFTFDIALSEGKVSPYGAVDMPAE